MISEELLHYIWRTKRFDHSDLKTDNGERLTIVDYGSLNPTDGPDFLSAKVKIGEIDWHGAVEIHIKSSDWHRHNHENDPNYKKTILHVVYENDEDISLPNEEKIPTLSLKARLEEDLIKTYKALDNESWIPCEKLINRTSQLSRISAKEKALTQRMHQKTYQVLHENELTGNNLEEVVYRLMLRAFGLKQNADAFLDIAKRIPLKDIQKNSHSPLAIEALLLGMAGMLNADHKDAYPRQLRSEFQFLAQKYRLKPPINSIVRHKGVRPAGFPEIRLSIFSQCVIQPSFFSKILRSPINDLYALLDASTSEYWEDHYTFDNKSPKGKVKKLGQDTKRVIIINAVVPALVFLGQRNQDEKKIQRAYSILEQLPGEKNKVIFAWQDLGISSENAYDSHSLLGLKKHFCDARKCLHCPIGHDILKSN